MGGESLKLWAAYNTERDDPRVLTADGHRAFKTWKSAYVELEVVAEVLTADDTEPLKSVRFCFRHRVECPNRR